MKSIYFDCHILKISLIGECKRFVSSNIVQKVLNEIWFNAYLFLEYHDMKIVYYNFNFFQVNDLVRRNLNKLIISFLKKQSLLSYFTFGYYAIKFQQEDLNQKPDQICNIYDKQIKVENQIEKKLNNDESSFYYIAPRLTDKRTKLKKTKGLNLMKYQNFIQSPRSHFVYNLVFCCFKA